jgi:hypothetical protein
MPQQDEIHMKKGRKHLGSRKTRTTRQKKPRLYFIALVLYRYQAPQSVLVFLLFKSSEASQCLTRDH